MKIKVSDFIADFFVKNGVHTIFTVVGGGAMHLNDSFGHNNQIQCVYHHHEQAASMAAEAYYRVNNILAGVCVTSGPGAINALNGVAGAYQDSIPMIVISGQCKSTLTVRKNKLKLRTLGPQEFDIVSVLDNFTKYAISVMDANDIQYCLEKAFFLALDGRPGPGWIEVPVDIQGTVIETDGLRHYVAPKDNFNRDRFLEQINVVIHKLETAKRPVLYAGNGIRIAGAYTQFCKLVNQLKIPVVTCWDSIDLLQTESPYYTGRAGTMGDRAGNFAVQNSDLLLVIGSRLNTYQVGYQLESWAREADVIVVDIDSEELKKPTIRVDFPVCADAKIFIQQLLVEISDKKQLEYKAWNQKCNEWKKKYPVVSEIQKQQKKPINIYGFIDKLSRSLPDNTITVVANGSASVVGSQAYYIGKGCRFIMNCAISSMGYDLPASIGACIANDKKQIICIAGDGSIQMNIQELQTIVTNHLPIKIIVINNDGYQQIRITQTNLFHSEFVGIGPESGDLGFPDLKKISYAYGIPYNYCDNTDDMGQVIAWLMKQNSFCMLEIQCDTSQFFEPKSATRKRDDGALYSPPLEDLAPFMDREELKGNMIIPLWSEK